MAQLSTNIDIKKVFPDTVATSDSDLRVACLKSKTHNRVCVPAAIPEKCYSTERVGISAKTHDEHLKLWQGYANKTNELLKAVEDLDKSPSRANQIFSEIRSIKVDYTFAYQGLANHNNYFQVIGGQGGRPTGRIAQLIEKSYGSIDRWMDAWKACGMAARGWVFLAYDPVLDIVTNIIGDAQNTFPLWDHKLVLSMDVYEHAYFIDFGAARMKYLEAYMQCIDWDAVNKFFES